MSRDRLFIVASIAVGMALLACMLSSAFAVLIDPLPFPQSNRIVTVNTVEDGLTVSTSLPDYNDLSEQGGPFTNSIYVKPIFGDAQIDGHPETLYSVSFEGDLFSVFQKGPLLGTGGDLDSQHPRDVRAAILSYPAWVKFFGQNSKALGKTIRVGQTMCEVRAILPPEYQLALPADIWVAYPRQTTGQRDNRDGRIYARLPTGVSTVSANAYLRTIASSLEKKSPESNQGVTFISSLLRDSLVGQSKTLLYLLALGATIVLCVAYLNVYQLLAAKAALSPRWILCLALGASRRRLFQDMLKEPLLLSLIGCCLGLFLSLLGTRTLRALSPADIPRIGDVRLVWQVALALFVISILAAALFTLFLLMRTISAETTTAFIHAGVRGGTSIRHAFGTKRQFLLVAQMALSTTLLLFMGMLATALHQATSSPLGFSADGVSVTGLDLKEPTNIASSSEYVRDVIRRVSTLPGVQSVAAASSVPFQRQSYTATFTSEEIGQEQGKQLQFAGVSPQFFQALQLPLLQGRSFLDSDSGNSLKVAILNRAAAQAVFGKVSGLNKRIKAQLGTSISPIEVIGIAENVRQDPTTVVAPPIVYLPLDQSSTYSVSLVVRSSVPVGNAEIKAQIWSLNRNQAVQETTDLASLIDSSLRHIRYMAFLMTLFATVTMLLSALGIYAAVAQWLSSSQREIALRLALGATYSQIRSSLITRIMAITGTALGIGLIAALATRNAMQAFFYGVQPQLSNVVVWGALLLGIVALISSYIPALRSRFINPAELLRSE